MSRWTRSRAVSARTIPALTTRTELTLLVNPSAGKGRAGRAADGVVRRLRHAGALVTVVSGADAQDTAREARAAVDAGVQTLVAVGGDGLVNLAVQAVAGTSTRLGIVPLGTGNDIGRALGMPPKDVAAAADILLRGHTRTIDLGRASQRWFAGVLGAGFDSAVNERANRMRWPRGPLRYNLAMAAELRTFRPLPFVLDLDGRHVEAEAMLVAVANGSFYGGGIRVCPDARLDDGLFDVLVVGPVSKAGFLRILPRVYSGRHVTHPAVRVHRVREVALAAPAVTAYADGERMGTLPISCAVVPRALTVLCP